MTRNDINLETQKVKLPIWMVGSILASAAATIWTIASSSTAIRLEVASSSAKLEAISKKVESIAETVSRQDERLRSIEKSTKPVTMFDDFASDVADNYVTLGL